MDDILNEIAKGLSSGQVVPFIGAGASKPHIKQDWDALRRIMLAELYGAAKSSTKRLPAHPKVAEAYVRQFGKSKFVQLLKQHLLIDDFVDSNGAAYLFLMGLQVRSYYTTNQDNVFEKCFAKYKRSLNVVASLDEMVTLDPTAPTLYKYHGSLDQPESIVFTATSYKQRYFSRTKLWDFHPMDIRLFSDLLGKSLLFIGYSFRDPNIMALFDHLYRLFGRKLPRSHLLQYLPDKNFATDVFRRYGVMTVDCTALYPSALSPADAFACAIADLSRTAFDNIRDDQIQDLFSSGEHTAIHIASPLDIENLLWFIESDSPSVASKIARFRAIIDDTYIPDDFEHRVTEAYCRLCRTASTLTEVRDLRAALFNLRLRSAQLAVDALSECYLCARLLPPFEGDFAAIFHPKMAQIPATELNWIAMARAIELHFDRHQCPGDAFLSHIVFDSLHPGTVAKMGDEAQAYIHYWYRKAFATTRNFSNPLRGKFMSKGRGSFQTIRDSMESLIPKRIAFPDHG